jgi:hypothetical protein
VEAVAGLFGVSWKPMGLDLVLAVIGALILLVLALQRGLGSRWAMAALVLGGQVALVVFGMRADFSRYLLPVLMTNAVCGGLVAGLVWGLLRARVARREVRPAVDSTPLAGEPTFP